MPLVKLYFSPALLLLVLTCPLWQVGQSSPVPANGQITDSCVLYARGLLQNITDTLAQKELFRGINCMEHSLELNMETDTATVCAPKEATCSGFVKSEFDQGLCLTNIRKDLHHYYKYFAARPDLSVLSGLSDLMENCPELSLQTDMASVEPATDDLTFDERLKLCKVLKGFHVRTITINRVFTYMNSGEHTK